MHSFTKRGRDSPATNICLTPPIPRAMTVRHALSLHSSQVPPSLASSLLSLQGKGLGNHFETLRWLTPCREILEEAVRMLRQPSAASIPILSIMSRCSPATISSSPSQSMDAVKVCPILSPASHVVSMLTLASTMWLRVITNVIVSNLIAILFEVFRQIRPTWRSVELCMLIITN